MPETSRPGLVLGTVQLGMPYGRITGNNQPDIAMAHSILSLATACAGGLDTAAAYGQSESVIGQCRRQDPIIAALPVTSKITPLPEGGNKDQDAAILLQSLENSRKALSCSKIHGLMMHRWENWTRHNGAMRDMLRDFQARGYCQHIGASLQSPEEARQALDDPYISILQLPCNLLDHRWHWIDAVRKDRPDVEIHVRSVFLQGILLSDDSDIWPHIPDLDVDMLHSRISTFVDRFDRDGPDDICLAWARAIPWADNLVIGCHHPSHLQRSADLFNRQALTPDQYQEVASSFGDLPESLLNPALWPTARK